MKLKKDIQSSVIFCGRFCEKFKQTVAGFLKRAISPRKRRPSSPAWVEGSTPGGYSEFLIQAFVENLNNCSLCKNEQNVSFLESVPVNSHVQYAEI